MVSFRNKLCGFAANLTAATYDYRAGLDLNPAQQYVLGDDHIGPINSLDRRGKRSGAGGHDDGIGFLVLNQFGGNLSVQIHRHV